jgi:non-ribosomal peptide synthetase component F
MLQKQNKTYTTIHGKPFSNHAGICTKQRLQLTPQGVTGTIIHSRRRRSRGYLNNEELTKAKFIKNPYSKEATSLMYGTGDLVKYLPMQYRIIGRVDVPGKIRGYR